MRPEHLKYALAEVPRYTSYPTAAQFSEAVSADTYLHWLKALDRFRPASLYVHVPFCEKLCWYCGCHMSVPNTYDRVAEYVGLLEREIELLSGALSGGTSLNHLHFGGGSPSMLKPEDFLRLMVAINRVFSFTDTAEKAMEADPRTLSQAMCEALAEGGINRVSLGVQDITPKVQKAINRIQPPELVEKAVENLHAAGITALNIDILYGLPYQTIDDVRKSVTFAVGLGASRLSVFGYAHVPWFKKHQKMIAEEALPGVQERFAMAEAAEDVLKDLGYVAVGLDHFAKADDPLAQHLMDGRLKRNFQGYTTDDATAMLPLGVSSIGVMPAGYMQNARDIGTYRKALGSGQLPIIRGVVTSADDRLRRDVIERIMCDHRADIGALCRSHGYPEGALDNCFARVDELASEGLVIRNSRQIEMTDQGRRFVRHLAASFDEYFKPSPARHSLAV